MAFLEVNAVSKKEGNDFALKAVSFTQQKFQKIAVAGATGSGKSTLLKIVAGILSPDTGQVWFEGERVKRSPEEKLLPGHKGIAYLSQHFELRNHYRMEELLSYANTLTHEEAMHITEICRVGHLLKRKATELSGGEKQRMALAILLVGAPRLLILDEPFSNLDLIHKNLLKKVIQQLGEVLDITCILVSHDPLDTISWADEIMVMRDGAIVQKAAPAIIYRNPKDEYVAGLFGKYNLLHPTMSRESVLFSKIFVRPEDFIIVAEKDSNFKGVVQQVKFYGSYYEVLIAVQEQTILFQTTVLFSIGDTIYLNYKQAHPWRLSPSKKMAI